MSDYGNRHLTGFGIRSAGMVEHDIDDPQLVTDESFQRIARAGEVEKAVKREATRHSLRVAEAIEFAGADLVEAAHAEGDLIARQIDDLAGALWAMVLTVGVCVLMLVMNAVVLVSR